MGEQQEKNNNNEKKKNITINLSQVQTDKSLFTMPLEIGMYFKDGTSPKIEIIKMDEKSKKFLIELDEKPVKIELDPNKWVLMEASFVKKK